MKIKNIVQLSTFAITPLFAMAQSVESDSIKM